MNLASSSFFRSSFSPSLISTFARHYHHAILIGGGINGRTLSRFAKPHLPELSEYLELKLVNEKFKEMLEVHQQSPKILFGNGENKFVIQRPGLISILWRKVRGTQNIFPIEPFENLKGKASLENISREFTNLAHHLKAGEHLLIYLTGHGLIFRGTVLWNEWFTKQYLTPRFLQTELKKLPQGVSITLYVDSCYSGIYQKLTTPGVTVLSSSIDTNPSHYTPGEINKSTVLIMNSLRESNLLIPFSSGSIQSNNFCATDSLSDFLETNLRNDSIFFKTKKIWKEFKQALSQSIPPFVSTLASVIAISTAIDHDKTGIIERLYDTKLAIILGKSTLPVVKTVTVAVFSVIFPKTGEYISSKWKKTYLYRNWYVFEDRRLIRKLASDQQLPFIPKELTEQETELMVSIFQALKNLKTVRSNDARYIHYYFLYDKAVLFTQTASLEKVRAFILIAKPLVLN